MKICSTISARPWTRATGASRLAGCWTIDSPEQLSYLDTGGDWLGLRSIGMVAAERRVGNRVSVEYRYYISSLASDAKGLLQATRSHWGIENRVHWVLDLSFREDESRVRMGNAAQNLAVIRHMASTPAKRPRLQNLHQSQAQTGRLGQ